MTRIVYLHGNQATHWSFAWASSVQGELEALGFQTFFETFPDSIIARQQYWLPFLEDHVKAGSNDILLGWSSGAVAAMRYAEAHQILGSVLVSPSCTDMGDELERASGYFDRPWQWQAIRENQRAIHLITAADDPFIPQQEFETIANALKPEHLHLHNGGHFIGRTTFPEVVGAVQRVAAIH